MLSQSAHLFWGNVQLDKIFQTLGTPDVRELQHMPCFDHFRNTPS
jgi:hypothetical protein